MLILVFDLYRFVCWHSNLNPNVQISMFVFEFECNQQIYVFLFQAMNELTARDLMSHTGQKVNNYSLKFKILAFEYAEIHGNRVAQRKFGVDRKIIREWRANTEEIVITTGKVKNFFLNDDNQKGKDNI